MADKKRVWPRIKLRGNDLLDRSGVIYTQILGDLLLKVDDGSGEYQKGFLHTSTTTMTVPNYHHQMWSRDVGRGIMELVRTGFLEEANQVVDFIFSNGMTYGNHYGRTIETGLGAYEVDGNVSILLACHMLWRYEGKKQKRAQQMLDQLMSVFEWFQELLDESPYSGLLKSQSELSGNPETDYFVYAVFATYGAAAVCEA